jgi:nicotinamidase/pyrazinamidase
MEIRRIETITIDVDPQKGFTNLCPNELPVKGGEEIAGELNKQTQLGCRRILTRDTHNPNGLWIADEKNPQFSKVGLPNIDIRWNRHCQVGTEGMDLIPGLPAPEKYSLIINKGIDINMHPYGACYHDIEERVPTGLIEYILHHNMYFAIIGGLALDYCVKTTAMQLHRTFKNYGGKTIINLTATRAIDFEGSATKAIKEMQEAGINIINSSDDIKSI